MADDYLLELLAQQPPLARRATCITMRTANPDGTLRHYGLNGEEYYEWQANGVMPEAITMFPDLLAAVKYTEGLTAEEWAAVLKADAERWRRPRERDQSSRSGTRPASRR